MALVHQKDRSVWLVLPVLHVDLLPALQLAALNWLETPVVTNRTAFLH
jgi:hypothetical protein